MGEQYDLDMSTMSFEHLNMLELFHHYLNTPGPTMLYGESNGGYG